MCDRFFLLVKENLREKTETDSRLVERLKGHLLLLPEERNDVCYTEMKEKLINWNKTNEIMDTLASYNLFCHRYPLKLVDIARRFCCTKDINDNAAKIEMLFS